MRMRILLCAIGIISILMSVSAQSDTTLAATKTDNSSDSSKSDTSKVEEHPLILDEVSFESFRCCDGGMLLTIIGGLSSFERRHDAVGQTYGKTFGFEFGRRGRYQFDTTSASTQTYGLYGAYSANAGVSPAPGAPTSAKPQLFNSIRFGVFARGGYGYSFGSGPQRILFLSGTSPLTWMLSNIDDDSAAYADNQPLARVGSSLRLGDAWMPAIEYRVSSALSFQMQYAWSQIYPRHMAWYWLGSATLEGMTNAITLHFIKEFAKASPVAAPIANFLLRSGVSVLYKMLRKNRMNWPFNTDAPLNLHTFSLGAAITI